MAIQTKYGETKKLLNNVLVPGAGAGQPGHMHANFQGILTGSGGALHAKIDVEFTEEDEDVPDEVAHWIWLATITLDVGNWVTAADDDSDGFTHLPGLGRVRGNVKEITGGDVAVTLLMGV